MPDFSLYDFAGDVGEEGANIVKNIVNKAGNFACGLYKDYPGALVKTIPDVMLRAFWDEMCKERPPGLPLTPATPFEGGQCDGIAYQVPVEVPVTYEDGEVGFLKPNDRLYGKIGAIRISYKSNNQFSVDVFCRGSSYIFGRPQDQGWYAVFQGANQYKNIGQPRILSVTRLDGQIDNCGNLPVEYPDNPIPPERLTGRTTINIRPNVSATVPIVIAPIAPTLSVPVTVDIGGVKVKFDFNGATVKFEGDAGDTITKVAGDVVKINQDTATIRNDVTNVRQDVNTVNNNVTKVEGDVATVINNINNVNTVLVNAPFPPGWIIEELPSEEPEKEEVPNLFAVRLRLTFIPTNAKQQFGIAAPNVLYAGWFEFRRGTYCFPREPIAFQEGIFKAPIGADGYAFTLYVGYQGEASVIKLNQSVDA